MVLGETGILGSITFVIFLIVFFVTCHQRHYTATLTLFAVYLSTNMAEATFFAPAGGGGVQWILMVVGGFVIDMNREVERQKEISNSSQVIDIQYPNPDLSGVCIEEQIGHQLGQDAREGEP